MTGAAQPTDSMKPIPADRFGYDEARHLLSRAGFGGTRDQIKVLLEWGPEKSVDHLLDDRAAMNEFEQPRFNAEIVKPIPEETRRAYRLALAAGDKDGIKKFQMIRQKMRRADRVQIKNMQQWWLRRMIETPHPFIEKMTLFWHGHFATGYRGVDNSWHMFMQNMFFRRNAIGSFETLLNGIIHDPAMLRYLNNNNNVRRSPNENLAREIMELFALGSGYTEKDIKEGARALTGYTFKHNDFIFRKRVHDASEKRIFGRRGSFDGDGFVRLILGRKQCAPFLTGKLYRFFVNEIPDPKSPEGKAVRSAMRKMSLRFLRSKYRIKPVLRELFLSEHFYDPSNRARLIKSPIELIVGTCRTLGTPLRRMDVTMTSADRMGQTLFFPPSVKGWEGGRSWINTATVFERQNAAAYLITGTTPFSVNRSNEHPYHPSSLLDDLRIEGESAAFDPRRVSPYLAKLVLGETATDRHTTALETYFRRNNNTIDKSTIAGALALLAASPEYQLA